MRRVNTVMPGNRRPSRARFAALVCLLSLGAPRLEAGSEPAPEPPPTRLAVLPSIDLAGGAADLAVVDTSLRLRLGEVGFDVLPGPELLAFLRARRIRHTGGTSQVMLAALGDALGVDAIFAASVDQCETEAPPRIALNVRLVSTRSARILWAGEVALAGEDRPGALGLNRVDDPDRLLRRAIDRLFAPLPALGLSESLPTTDENPTWKREHGKRRYGPVRVYRAAEFDARRQGPARVAVLPFENASAGADAGQIVSGLFVTHLAGREDFEVIEPGEVREQLLAGRVIQTDGLSLAQADWVREMLHADLAVTGRVTEFSDFGAGTVPRVAFSVWVIDVRRRSVVWSAYSSSHGGDGVVFFDIGRLHSARALAGAMVRAAADVMAEGTR